MHTFYHWISLRSDKMEKNNAGKYDIIGYLKFADLFTLGNLISGFLAITFFINREFYTGCGFLVLAVIFDYIDGPIARKTGCSEYGKYLDFADMVSFGTAPAVLIVMVMPDVIGYVSALLLLTAGLLRMARYAVLPTSVAIGMAITFNGLIFPILYVIVEMFGLPLILYPIMSVISSGLMLSTFESNKG
jgi:CDP-diacylglycerol--serine O-phosphatidyltransferase